MNPLQQVASALFPSLCASCGEVLAAGERQLCMHCLNQLSETVATDLDDNRTERLLMGRVDFVAAASLYDYRKQSVVRDVVHAMKFHSNTELCTLMGRQLGLALLASGRFDDVDLLVPVPLHWWRHYRRGYNQSHLLCLGIACNLPRPINTTALVRRRYTHKQSLQRASGRESNVSGAFRVKRPGQLEGKHILLVDDVVTTGATLASCYDALRTVEGLRVSVATLALAGTN